MASGARRRPDSDYRFTPGARQARPRAARLPRLAILLHSCSRPEQPQPPPPPPSPSVRIGWRPGRRHFPTARGACGSPAALQARPWHMARPIGARGVGLGGAVAIAGLVSRAGPPFLPAAGPPPPAAPSRAPGEPTHCRRAGAGSRGGAQPASASARPAPIRLPIRAAKRQLAGARGYPGAAAPPLPQPLRLPRPPPIHGKGRSVGKGWLSFNRRLSLSGISVHAPPAAERRAAAAVNSSLPAALPSSEPTLRHHEESSPRLQLLG